MDSNERAEIRARLLERQAGRVPQNENNQTREAAIADLEARKNLLRQRLAMRQEERRKYEEEKREARLRCESTVLAVVNLKGMHVFDGGSAIQMPRDILSIIARMIWHSRADLARWPLHG